MNKAKNAKNVSFFFQVTVAINDVNDHAPVIEQTNPVAVTVLEHSEVGTLITVISAVDAIDFGDNTHVVYEIVSGNDDSEFPKKLVTYLRT